MQEVQARFETRCAEHCAGSCVKIQIISNALPLRTNICGTYKRTILWELGPHVVWCYAGSPRLACNSANEDTSKSLHGWLEPKSIQTNDLWGLGVQLCQIALGNETLVVRGVRKTRDNEMSSKEERLLKGRNPQVTANSTSRALGRFPSKVARNPRAFRAHVPSDVNKLQLRALQPGSNSH